MRLPDIDKYKDARNGQAYPYFMPWLSGDGGLFFIPCYMIFNFNITVKGVQPRVT
jgi:hypothetical protein